MTNFICDCGGKVKKLQAKGKFFPYGEFGKIKLTRSCKVLLCDTCGEYYENADDQSLQDALKNSLTDNAIEITKFIKENHGIRDNQLAFFCSLTPETFSRCKNKDSGKVMPAYAFLLLKGVAMHGKRFMSDLLETRWDTEKTLSSTSSGEQTKHGPMAAKAY